MIDAVVEAFLSAVARVVGAIAHIFFEVIVEVVLFGVGWFVVWTLTLGRIRLDRSSTQQRVIGAVIGFFSVGLVSLGAFLIQPPELPG